MAPHLYQLHILSMFPFAAIPAMRLTCIFPHSILWIGIESYDSLFSSCLHQISKLSMVPVVCVLEWILHSKTYTKEVKAAVVVVVVGVAVCTVTDVHINFGGFVSALIAVLSSSLQQIVSLRFCQSITRVSHVCSTFTYQSIGYMYVSMYVFVSICIYLCICIYVSMYLYPHVSMHLCIYVFVSICIYVSM